MSIPQSAAYTVLLKAYLSSDHVSPATGKTLAVTISKAGGAFGNPSAGASNATEVANGWYSYALSTTDTGTIGDLVVRLTGAAVDDAERVLQVVSATTGGASNLDAAVSSRSTYAGTDTAGTTTLLARVTGTLPLASDYSAARAAKLDNLDAAVSSRSTYAGGDTAGTTTLLARLTAGRATNLDNLDAAISSRLAAAGYTAPPTATAVADAVLSRDVSSVEATAPEHSLCYVVLSASEASVTGTTLTVKRTDGATTFATKTLTVSAGASPVTGVA